MLILKSTFKNWNVYTGFHLVAVCILWFFQLLTFNLSDSVYLRVLFCQQCLVRFLIFLSILKMFESLLDCLHLM